MRNGGRKPTGTVQKTCDGRWRGRITLADGSRQWLDPFPPGTSEAMARERTAALTEQAIAMGLKSTGPKPSPAQAKLDCEAWVNLWLDERDRRALSSRVTKEGHWKHHIAPVLSTKHPRHWTRNDFRTLSAALDRKVQAEQISWKTAVDIWGTATKMADDACNSKHNVLRCRDDDSPALRVKGPDRGAAVSKQYLFPSEVGKLLACEVVPEAWERLFAVAIYTYCRASELRALTWDDVDLQHNIIRITKAVVAGSDTVKSTKSKRGRTIPIEPTLRPLLVAMRESCPTGQVLPGMPSPYNLSAGLKRWLKVAKVDRSSLTSKGPSERPIRFHDLRATGITWMAVRGDEAQKIQARAGHSNFSTTQGYIREAEVLREGFGEPFGPLPARLGQKFCLRVLPTNCASSQK